VPIILKSIKSQGQDRNLNLAEEKETSRRKYQRREKI